MTKKHTNKNKSTLVYRQSSSSTYRTNEIASMKERIETFFQKNESTISLVLGVTVVLISAFLLFRYIKVWRNRTALLPESTATTQSEPLEIASLPTSIEVKEEDGKIVPEGLPATYVVQKGDSSWKIAQAFYGSGYNYVDIEKENNLKHNQHLEVGMKLTVPKSPVISLTEEKVVSSVSVSQEKQDAPKTYTVKKGDHLWKIAVSVYSDGYKWTEIYTMNKDLIKHPNSIEVGMVLRLQ